MTSIRIPFVSKRWTPGERAAVARVLDGGRIAGGGAFAVRAERMIAELVGARKVILTNSCSAALEMAAILLELGPGDEVIMPSFTFVATATAFALRGARPVFADIAPDTLSMEEATVAPLVTARTRAVVAVHYNGVSRGLSRLRRFCDDRDLYLIEDAAQAVLCLEEGRHLGTVGHLGAYSFHDTKVFTAGEGGALLVNDDRFAARAEIFADKGTDRAAYSRGERPFYSWVDLGASVRPGEMNAALLAAQLERRDEIIAGYRQRYERYQDLLKPLERLGRISLFKLPGGCQITYGMHFFLVRDAEERGALLGYLHDQGVEATFHYVPLHGTPFGRRIAHAGDLPVTEDRAARLVRLPMSESVGPDDQDYIIAQINRFYGINA